MNENCLSYWFPKLEGAGLPVPKTQVIYTDVKLIALCDGVEPVGFKHFLAELTDAVLGIGTPCFLRTGQGSGKHNWKRTCFVPDDDGKTLTSHVAALVEWSECVDFMGLPWDVWAVRELLPTKPIAALPMYGDMPLCREFRSFCRNGEVLYTVPYWPKDAIAHGWPYKRDADDPYVPANFLEIVKAAQECTTEEWSVVEELASRAGAAVGGEWSVDILDTERGWFVTDMAIAERSYGYDPEKFGK